MKKEYCLNDYYKYAEVVESLTTGFKKVNEQGWLINGDGYGCCKEEWIRNLAYYHWWNKDDLLQLFDKLGICKEQREWILDYYKKFAKGLEKNGKI